MQWVNRIWLQKQKGDLKLIISVAGGGLSAALGLVVVPPGAWWAGLIVIPATIITLATRYALDRLDFLLSDNPS